MSNRLFVIGSLLAMALLLLSACSNVVTRGSGNIISESRAVSDFTRISLVGSADVVITQGDEESLIVETDDNIMELVSTEVRDGTLHLGTEGQLFSATYPTTLRFIVQMKDISGLAISGSGDISSETISTKRLDIDCSGSGDIEIGTLTADQLNIDITGSATVKTAGNVAKTMINITGSGDVIGGDLKTDAVTVDISGSGDVTLWVVETLGVEVSGSGSISYYGEPKVSSDISGSGDLNSLGDK